MKNIIDISEHKRKYSKSSKPDWTPEEIKTKIQPLVDYLNTPNKVFYSKKGDRWTEEENEQFKRLVFKYTVECYSCTAMADEIKRFFPWRTASSILSKISDIRQSCYEELEKFYTVINYGDVVVRDAQLHYSSITGKIDFGNYIHYRMLQLAGLLPEPKLSKQENGEIKEKIEEADTLTQIAVNIFNMNKKKRIKEITEKEAEELLLTTCVEIRRITNELNIDKITTKNLLYVAKKLNNSLGETIRGLEPIFADKEKTKQWKRAEKWRQQRHILR
jgi:hypothetical protein